MSSPKYTPGTPTLSSPLVLESINCISSSKTDTASLYFVAMSPSEEGGAPATHYILKTLLALLFLQLLSLAMIVCKQLCNFLYTYWWKPRTIKKIMERQGIRGPPPRFISGNLSDMTKLRESEAAKDMEPISHDIVDRLLPHYVQWTNDYGMSILPLLVENSFRSFCHN